MDESSNNKKAEDSSGYMTPLVQQCQMFEALFKGDVFNVSDVTARIAQMASVCAGMEYRFDRVIMHTWNEEGQKKEDPLAFFVFKQLKDRIKPSVGSIADAYAGHSASGRVASSELSASASIRPQDEASFGSFATELDLIRTLECLWEHGVGINVQDFGKNTLLHHAIKAGFHDLTHRLMEKEIDPLILNRAKESVLGLALNASPMSVIRWLTGACDIHDIGESDAPNILFKLLEHPDKASATALLKELLPLFDLSEQDEHSMTMLHHAATQKNEPAMDLLISAEAKVNAITRNGKTPLHLALCRPENLDCVKTLLQAGADLNQADFDRKTALHYAVFNQDVSILKLILDQEIDIHATSFGEEGVLHMAYQASQLEHLHLLLEAGAHINAVNREGMTVLHKCVRHYRDNFASIQFLVESGADLSIKDEDGFTPLELARDMIDCKMAKLEPVRIYLEDAELVLREKMELKKATNRFLRPMVHSDLEVTLGLATAALRAEEYETAAPQRRRL